MTDRKAEIVNILEHDAEETKAFFANLSAEQLSASVYQEGAAWTARQVLAHLITIEQSMQRLFENILAGKPEASKDFEIERFNRSQPRKLDGLMLTELIARFQEVRSQTIAKVRGMAETDLDREGIHPFHGPGHLERFVRWAYEHCQGHLNDTRRAIGR
jgi:hypothetical protein